VLARAAMAWLATLSTGASEAQPWMIAPAAAATHSASSRNPAPKLLHLRAGSSGGSRFGMGVCVAARESHAPIDPSSAQRERPEAYPSAESPLFPSARIQSITACDASALPAFFAAGLISHSSGSTASVRNSISLKSSTYAIIVACRVTSALSRARPLVLAMS